VTTTRRRERRARARALQALYACDVRGGDRGAVVRVVGHMFDDLAVEPGERAMAESLVRSVTERSAEVDELLSRVTVHWRLDRLGAIERSLLRLAAAELLRGETPQRVVLQEAVRLAERFGGMESARFVNGVLDALARDVGRL
jgi:N utilization substance protein B